MTDRHDEHYESIPWDSLVTGDARRRRRWLYLGIGLIVALALGGAIGRAFGGSGGTDTTLAASDVPTTSNVATTTSTMPPAVETAANDALAVRSHAEWFVADYFTVDGSDVTRQSVIDRLPPGVTLPATEGTGRSFVESVFTTDLEQVDATRYRVVLVVRSLAAADGVSYARQPARVVAVTVETTPRGPAIVDLPRPVEVDLATAPGLDVSEGEAPQPVLDAATAEAGLWGEPVGDPAAGRVGDIWRVVQLVRDEQGLIWPIASWFDNSGSPAQP